MRGAVRRHDFFPITAHAGHLVSGRKKAPITTVMSATMIHWSRPRDGLHYLGSWKLDRVSAGLSFLKLLTESHTPKHTEYFTRTGRQGSPVALAVRHTRALK